jgi:prophage tail gpP-like protein
MVTGLWKLLEVAGRLVVTTVGLHAEEVAPLGRWGAVWGGRFMASLLLRLCSTTFRSFSSLTTLLIKL